MWSQKLCEIEFSKKNLQKILGEPKGICGDTSPQIWDLEYSKNNLKWDDVILNTCDNILLFTKTFIVANTFGF